MELSNKWHVRVWHKPCAMLNLIFSLESLEDGVLQKGEREEKQRQHERRKICAVIIKIIFSSASARLRKYIFIQTNERVREGETDTVAGWRVTETVRDKTLIWDAFFSCLINSVINFSRWQTRQWNTSKCSIYGPEIKTDDFFKRQTTNHSL